jgi:multidrug efflux system membrane fusion protein
MPLDPRTDVPLTRDENANPALDVKAAPVPAEPKRSAARRRLWPVIVLALVATAGWWVWTHRTSTEKPGEQKGAGQFPVPVVAGTVEKKDVPIYLDGLGTIQALNTVTVRARVDGEIMKVAFTEGQDVKEGELLVQIDDASFKAAFDQAVAKKGQDEAQLANAQLDLARYLDLSAKKVISSQQYDTQKALVHQLEAAVQSDAAAIQSAKVQLDYTRVGAPIDGRAGIRLVDQGNVVRASDLTGLVVLTQLRPISLLFTLPEQTLGAISKQTKPEDGLTVLAVDRDNKTELDKGHLAVIDNQIDSTTGTIRLKATFPNQNLQLWPGQFVNARLLLTVRKDGIVVAASVIQRGPQGAFAFVIKADDTVEIRPIKVAQIEQGQALIEEGLEPGERVVVDGQYKLQANSHVKIADPAAKPGAPGAAHGPHAGTRPK